MFQLLTILFQDRVTSSPISELLVGTDEDLGTFVHRDRQRKVDVRTIRDELILMINDGCHGDPQK
ncbi:hypothetical protein D3C75_1276480 [compost metagenome]